MADKVGVRDQDSWRFVVSAKNAHRFAGLDEQGFVVLGVPGAIVTIASNASQLRAARPVPP